MFSIGHFKQMDHKPDNGNGVRPTTSASISPSSKPPPAPPPCHEKPLTEVVKPLEEYIRLHIHTLRDVEEIQIELHATADEVTVNVIERR